ncbi:MAG: ribosome maturation factor RimM [Thermotogota bacterium]|nr:ribosome maturation factor RimM [Thermotogota bacterium]
MIHDLRSITSDKIAIGIVKSSHGLKGEVKVKAYTNYTTVFESGMEYLLYNSERKRHLIAKADTIKNSGKHLIVRFEGFESIEDAKKISGFEIYISLEQLPEIEEDGYYFYQLLDSQVIDENDHLIGRVVDIIETGSSDVLSVFPEDYDQEQEPEKEIMIPIVRDFIVWLDKEKKQIKVRIPKYYKGNVQD